MKKESREILMDPTVQHVSSCHIHSIVSKCFILVLIVFVLRILVFSSYFEKQIYSGPALAASNLQQYIRKDKFLEVPQIAWGLNNQKIAFARAALTAKFLNRTLLMPSLSASLFYKEINLLEPISFDKIFNFEKFNSLCVNFLRLGRYSDILNQSKPFELQKGSGRRWTRERDFAQLKQCKESSTDEFEVIRILGKNPFLWHDHWPVKDYAKILECLVLVDEIENEAEKVISAIREVGNDAAQKQIHVPYVAVHMRIEKDWMIHCKKMELKSNTNQICSSKEEIIERVGRIEGLHKPSVVYAAVADSLLEDGSILDGWREGVTPYEKKKLGVWDIYKKYPYLIQSAIDYEVCSRSDIFVGNSFSTFSSLVVLDRTQKLIKMDATGSCGMDVGLVSYAYNIQGKFGGPRRWMTDMSSPSLEKISYGTVDVDCRTNISSLKL